METSFTLAQAQVWHHVFSQNPVGVLEQALLSGLVEKECLWEGRDLLFSLLSRPPSSFLNGAREWWDSPESVQLSSGEVIRWSSFRLAEVQDAQSPIPEPARKEAEILVSLASTLLRRSEVDPLRQHSMHIDGAPAFIHPVSSLQVALAANLVPVVELIGQWAARNEKEKAFRRQLVDLDTEGLSPLHRTVGSSRVPLLQYLLEQGADPSARDARGRPSIFHTKDQKTLEILLSVGVDPGETVNGRTLLDTWSSLDRRGPDSPYSGLISHLISKGAGNEQESLAANAWLWLDKTPLELSWFDSGKTVRISQGWAHGWETKMVPALGGSPLHAFSRTINSGPLRGEVNFAADVGFRWIKSKGALEVWPALLKNPGDAIAPSPSEIRKGLTDWGVLALGAARHVSSQIPVSAQSNQPTVSMLKESRERLERALRERAPAAEWETHLLQAAQVLQRPKNGPMWRDVAIALTAHANNQGQGKDGLSLEVAEEKLDFVLKALAAGTRWPSTGSEERGRAPLNILATTHTAIQTRLQGFPGGEASSLMFKKWAAVATAVLADTAVFNTFCSQEDKFRPGEYSFFIRKNFTPMIKQSEGYLSLIPGPAMKRVLEAFPLLEQWSPEAFLPVREAYMDKHLPQPRRQPSPRQRF